jgi:hypothetical protein
MTKSPARTATRIDEDRIDEADLANQRMGNNQLQGNDQQSVRNQRHDVPGSSGETEGVIESFENLDPKVRAERQRQKKP